MASYWWAYLPGHWGTMRPEYVSPRDGLKRVVQHVLGHLSIYRLQKRPLLIFTTRRSGSTLLLHMLYTQPHTDYVNEPLNLWLLHPHYTLLPHPPLGKFVTLSDEDAARLRMYFSRVLGGQWRVRNQWAFWRPYYSLVVHRLVVKMLNANALLEWFVREFNVDVIYLIRHPVPVAASIIRQQWEGIAEAYLQNQQFCDVHLGSELCAFARRVWHTGSPIQRFVLEWALENIIPLRLRDSLALDVVTYEELVTKPREVAQWLSERYDFPDPERMYQRILTPSPTTATQSSHLIRQEGPATLVQRSLAQIPRSELALAQEVLDAFGIDIYRADEPWPLPAYSIFSSE